MAWVEQCMGNMVVEWHGTTLHILQTYKAHNFIYNKYANISSLQKTLFKKELFGSSQSFMKRSLDRTTFNQNPT